MTSDIQTSRTVKAYSEPVKRRPGQAGQDFESLLRKRTESYRADKAKADSSESRMVRTDSEDSMEKDIRQGIASLEAEKTGRSGLKDEGQDETEKDISAAGCLVHGESWQQEASSTARIPTIGQKAEDLLEEGGEAGSVPILGAGPAEPTQRLKDDVVKEIPTLPEETLQRMADPAEFVKAQQKQEGPGQAGKAKTMTEPFLKSIQEDGPRADSLKDDSLKKEALGTENLNRIAETMKNMEKPGSTSQDPMETRMTTDRIRDLILKERTREDSGHEASGTDAGMEGLKGLSSAMKAGEARVVQETQKPEGRMAADRNLELAATNIVHQVETLKDGDRTTIRVRLYPEEIGEMEITLSMEEGKLSGKILVENREMRQVFTERLSELNQTLKACQIDVAKFEVGIGAGQQQGQAGSREQRQAAYPERLRRYGAETIDREEITKTVRKAASGIDVLA